MFWQSFRQPLTEYDWYTSNIEFFRILFYIQTADFKNTNNTQKRSGSQMIMSLFFTQKIGMRNLNGGKTKVRQMKSIWPLLSHLFPSNLVSALRQHFLQLGVSIFIGELDIPATCCNLSSLQQLADTWGTLKIAKREILRKLGYWRRF